MITQSQESGLRTQESALSAEQVATCIAACPAGMPLECACCAQVAGYLTGRILNYGTQLGSGGLGPRQSLKFKVPVGLGFRT